MGYDNVKLWFAKNEHNEIITIDDLKDSNTYLCPVCGSDLIPKATESKRITPHFAHADKSKCSNESMMHFWFKHKFLEVGDQFKVITDKEYTFVCKEVLVEQQYNVGDKIYIPDVTVITECGETIYFEMNYSNKKKVKDYIDVWLELKNIVVEIDIKQLMNKAILPSFKALFYEGKCFNTKKNDTYYNTIGRYKEELYKNEVTEEVKERIRKLDWFWSDILKYKNGDVDIEYIVDLIDLIKLTDRDLIEKLLKKSTCSNLKKEYDYLTSSYQFSKILPKEHFLRVVVKDLNRIFKALNKKFHVKLERCADYDYYTEWWYGKKQKRQRVNFYMYDLLLCDTCGYTKARLPVTNRLLKMNDTLRISDYIKIQFLKQLKQKGEI